MALDLGNVKAAAHFLQRTEIKFDLTSAVTELAKQIKLEFDFAREAKIMDQISTQLQVCCCAVALSKSTLGMHVNLFIPGAKK